MFIIQNWGHYNKINLIYWYDNTYIIIEMLYQQQIIILFSEE